MRFGLGRAGWVDVLGWNKGLKVPRFDVTGDALTVEARLEGLKKEGAEEEGGGEEDQARARLTLTPAPWRQQSQAGIPPAT